MEALRRGGERSPVDGRLAGFWGGHPGFKIAPLNLVGDAASVDEVDRTVRPI